jgi:hypothetical protein
MRPRRLLVVLLLAALLLGGLLGPPAPAAAQEEACFAETNQCLRGRFLAYWQQNGGLARNGFPLTDERRELLEDGREYTVQYFERVRLEYHPENAPPFDVLLGQFGRRMLRDPFGIDPARYQAAIAPAQPLAGRAYFTETGHNVAPDFLAYWETNGGLAQFGYPLSEEFEQPLGAGLYTVQYFERARFERHPENASPYDVLLGQFGREILRQNDLLAGRFGLLYLTDERARELLGPPRAPAAQVQGATQEFERGRMFYYRSGISVLCGDPQAGRAFVSSRLVLSIDDTWDPSQPVGGGPGPRPGLYEPARGFGKVWRERPGVRECLGYATTPDETFYPLTVQDFARGVLLSLPDGQAAYVLYLEASPEGVLGRYERFPLQAR